MKKNAIEISNEVRENMIKKIQKYYLNERDEEIGDLEAILLLDFIIEKLASEFYNAGVRI